MANRRQRKKRAKRELYLYEGTQYRGGRASGEKNLKRTNTGTLINQHGVEFTEAEKKALESAVNTANRKRANMLKQEAILPRVVNGVDTGQKKGQLHLMGLESDFIISRKTKSLQRFKSREDYDRYMKNLERVNSRDYIGERVKLYKRNHMKAIENEFGDEGKDVLMKIRMMKPEDYMKYVQSDENLEIGFIYDPQQKAGRLNSIRASLGMKLKEDNEEIWEGYE